MTIDMTEGFLVVGVSDEVKTMDGDVLVSLHLSQTSLVGVATSKEEAENLIGQDYINMLNNKSIYPLTHAISRSEGIDEPDSYSIPGYTWHVIPLQFNTLLNFTLQ